MCIKPQFKRTPLPLIRYINTKIFVGVGIDWDGNDLLFTKWLQMMNKLISYSYAKKIMNSIEIYGKH